MLEYLSFTDQFVYLLNIVLHLVPNQGLGAMPVLKFGTDLASNS